MSKDKTNMHIVQSLVFDIELPHQAMAANIQDRISLLTEKRLTTILDSLLSEVDDNDQNIVIDKLTLDIGELTNDESFEDLIEDQLKNTLREYLNEQLTNPSLSSSHITVHNVNDSLLESLIFFLKSGHLPWSVQHEKFNDLNKLFTELQQSESQAIRQILEQIKKDSNALYRLVVNLNDKLIKEIIKQHLLINTRQLDNLISDMEFVIHYLESFNLNPIKKQAISQFLLSQVEATSLDNIFESWLDSEISPILNKANDQQLFLIKQSPVKIDHQNQVAKIAKNIFHHWLTEKINKTHSLPIDTKNSTHTIPKDSHNNLIQSIDEDEAIKPPHINHWFIKNSGLILLWPYLGRYFKAIGLVDKGKFIGINEQQKALYELEYLIHGANEFREYDLVLNKVLCGIEITATIDPELKTGAIDPEAAKDLLNSAIKNWPLIANTSLIGFRKSFLSREGKLIEHEKHWQLIIDRKGYDALLDQLPYSLNAIKLPWMNKPVYVEW